MNRTRHVRWWVVGVCSWLGVIGASEASAQQSGDDPFVPGQAPAEPPPPPPPDQYAPPQQVYTVDVYEQPNQPYQPPGVAADPANPGRRRVVPYEDGMTIPPNGYIRNRRRTGLIVGGAVLFGVSYFLTGSIGSLALWIRDVGTSSTDDTVDQRIWVPVVGPMLVSETGGVRAAAIMSGMMQVTGLVMFITGFAAKQRQLVYYTDSGRGLQFGFAPTRDGAMASLTVF